MNKWCINYLILITLLMPVTGRAGMHLYGTLIDPPNCTVNNGQPINVNFGNVGVSRINGINFEQDVPYILTCSAVANGLDLNLRFTGQIAPFDGALLGTDVTGLGIKLKVNGADFNLNNAVAIDPNNPPQLKAVPVKDSSAVLSASPFSATGTLIAEYQ